MDLTILHTPSTLYLPLPPPIKETGPSFGLNRRSAAPRPLISIPMVTVEMVDTGPPPLSPVSVQDTTLLSPPRRTFKSRVSPAVKIPARPSSAPLERSSGRNRSINSSDHSSRSKTPDPVYCRPNSIPILDRPPTTLFRPKPFWRNTLRSAVSGTFYASSLHPIRRSTFIAAGLRFDKPIADLSALGVESRIGIVVLLPDSLY
ncbi:hypothetical protein B0F90DRAFT_1817807 [Multifurca ochricompacta]|uniref:Uncharacterized protein n=1 Tax=Multifurca ochricompacta TaxID=376703 RepID=A0AAD4QN03_9AGAM|nr:hypothetical protein B0F90DRAFT_1817807 [Multifurca ochricompacta]